MRVDHVAPHFYPEIGGLESQVLRLSEFLVERGHEVVVHTSRVSTRGGVLPERGTIGKIEIRRYEPLVRLGYYATLFHPQVSGAQLVHLHGYAHLSNDWTARRIEGVIPSVYSLHHGVAQPPPTLSSRLKRGVYDPLVGLRTLRRMSAIVSASEADRRWLDARGFRGNVHVIPTGLDDLSFAPGSPERAHERVGIDRYVLFLGRLHREKSAHDLLRAVASIRGSPVSVVLAGPDAGDQARLVSLASSLGLGGRPKFTGEVDEVTKRDLLAGCEALILPSFYEAQGIAILEAWAQSRPVVASRVGGVSYLVEEGRDGLLYPWGDVSSLCRQIERILADPAAARSMGERGREKAWAEFRWKNLAPRFLEVYDGVTRGSARA